MLSTELFFTDTESDSDGENYRVVRKQIRDSSDPFKLSNETFAQLFRINKDAFSYILKVMEDCSKPRLRSTSVPNYIKLAAALRFFAEGGYQRSVGQDFNIGLSQSKTSLVLAEVLNILEEVLCPIWISFKMNEEEKQKARRHFFENFGFPGIIGCVDGTHIKIIAPTEREHLFFNRKGYHSLNAMIVCDNEMKIRAVDARYGGASHDSHVWELSEIRRYLRANTSSGN